LRARTRDGHGTGVGAVRFLQSDGLSVISDIDDTIKITQVPAGKRTVLRNTFLRDFRAAEGMRERFRGMISQASPNADVCFHYISGGPWQLFAPLQEFLVEREQFPRGTFHMKHLRTNLFDSGALQTINDFAVAGDLATLDQKVRQITELMIHFPKRKFILIGDSGEKDPEVYHAIRKLFPEQVIRIIIRDVLCERLAGMELITGSDVPVTLDTTALVRDMEQLVVAARAVAAQSEKL
jgi:phosphatidate phosphatase APP1